MGDIAKHQRPNGILSIKAPTSHSTVLVHSLEPLPSQKGLCVASQGLKLSLLRIRLHQKKRNLSFSC